MKRRTKQLGKEELKERTEGDEMKWSLKPHEVLNTDREKMRDVCKRGH